jgi:hypothetical protein
MFFEESFYVDQNLPKNLFKRLIVENDGSRVSILNGESSMLSNDVDYIITNNYDKYPEYSEKMIYYQHIFECVKSKSLLYPEFYRVNILQEKRILNSVVAVVDKSVGEKKIMIINKMKSLGAMVKNGIDMRVTHLISQRESSDKTKGKSADCNDINYTIVTPDWVDECLYTLKHLKGNKFSINSFGLSLKRRLPPENRTEEMLFQFAGLPSVFKQKIIDKLTNYDIKFSESKNYENSTHLIMGEFSLSEKFFGALVNGRWILTPDFIDNFENQQNFDFKKYEWVNGDEKDKKKIESIRKWREKIQTGGKKLFCNWKIELYYNVEKYESYFKLIKHGGEQ